MAGDANVPAAMVGAYSCVNSVSTRWWGGEMVMGGYRVVANGETYDLSHARFSAGN